MNQQIDVSGTMSTPSAMLELGVSQMASSKVAKSKMFG